MLGGLHRRGNRKVGGVRWRTEAREALSWRDHDGSQAVYCLECFRKRRPVP